MLQDLVRSEGVQVIETVEDHDLDTHLDSIPDEDGDGNGMDAGRTPEGSRG